MARKLEHLAGIEPASSGWKPDVIPKLRQMQIGLWCCQAQPMQARLGSILAPDNHNGKSNE
jgi:hypothetical protein